MKGFWLSGFRLRASGLKDFVQESCAFEEFGELAGAI